MGQIFGNINDPRARDSGRGSFSNPSAPVPATEPVRPAIEETAASLQAPEVPMPPATAGVGRILQSRKEELEHQLAAATHLVSLSQKRASDLTLDELTAIWDSL